MNRQEHYALSQLHPHTHFAEPHYAHRVRSVAQRSAYVSEAVHTLDQTEYTVAIIYVTRRTGSGSGLRES